ncbi:hypothetical protein [Halomicronema sp. CCY15110]|uniref:hypothetical protein n=1 Tax=Halomicronema sp. CCY15110 TaxID=2767773 RepID=UPI00194F0A6B|nr:hypothetical protein [Halomicronema sp. CCY15110]
MMLDNLRSELLKIDSHHTSIDRRFGFPEPNTVYTAADIGALISTFTHQFQTCKVRESRTIARFNQQLTQLTETWRTVGSA